MSNHPAVLGAEAGGQKHGVTPPDAIKRNNSPPPKCFRILAFTALLILGIYGLVGMSLNIYDLLAEEGHGTWPFNHRPAKATLTILQAFLVLGFLLGGVGAWRGNSNWYFWASLDLLGVATILAIFGIVSLRASRSEFEGKLLILLEKGGWDDYNWIDFIQHHHKCCGINSYANWARINGKLNPDGDSRAGFHLNKTSLPASCCKQDGNLPPNDKNCGGDALSHVENWEEFKARIYVKPCGPEIIRPAREALINLGIEMLVVAFWTLAISLFLYCGASELFCLAPDRPQDRRGRGRNRRGRGHSANYNTDDEEDDDDEEEEEEDDNDNQNIEVQLSKNLGEQTKGQSQDGTSSNDHSSKRERGRRALQGNNVPVGDGRNKTKSRQVQNKSLAKGGADNLQIITKARTKSKSRSKKSRQKNESNNAKAAAMMVKGNPLNNVPFGHHHASYDRNNNSGTRSDMILQKLEMLHVGNNVSTLSTTPNPSGSLFFPWSNNNNSPPPSQPTPTTATTTTAGKSGGNKATKGGLPLMSHYSSVPHFPHLNQQPAQPHHTHHSKGQQQQWLLPSFCNPFINKAASAPTKEQENPHQAQVRVDHADDMIKVDVEFDSNFARCDDTVVVVMNVESGQGQSDHDNDAQVLFAEQIAVPKELDTLLLPLEAANNAMNLIIDNDISNDFDNNDAQKISGGDMDQFPSPDGGDVVVFEEDGSSSSSSESTSTSSASVFSAANVDGVNIGKGGGPGNVQPSSDSSLGFEHCASSESEDDEASASASSSSGGIPLSDGDLPRKKSLKFPTLPTIVEEPEPNGTPKKDGSDDAIKLNNQISSSIANANNEVDVFGGGA